MEFAEATWSWLKSIWSEPASVVVNRMNFTARFAVFFLALWSAMSLKLLANLVWHLVFVSYASDYAFDSK